MKATTPPTKAATPTGESWTFGRFSRVNMWMHRVMTQRLARSFPTYQPVMLHGEEIRPGSRESLQRWSVIADALAGLDAGSFLDLGCAEGYFVMQAARRGWIALGVDGDLRRLAVAQNVALCDGLSRAGFLHGSITAGFVRKLPCFDVVLFLSVLHHVMCEQGVSGASELLRAIRSRTGMRLIFDMGQSNETTYDWAPLLPRMDPDPATWITGLLESCGFSSVRIIGETQGFMGAHPRHLFLAEP